jgi:hypothetical protein
MFSHTYVRPVEQNVKTKFVNINGNYIIPYTNIIMCYESILRKRMNFGLCFLMGAELYSTDSNWNESRLVQTSNTEIHRNRISTAVREIRHVVEGADR